MNRSIPSSGVLLLALVAGCARPPTGPAEVAPESAFETASASIPPAPTVGTGPIRFADITDRSGIGFVHDDGGSGLRFIPEAVTGGLALFDYDGDGLIDVYLLSGAPLPPRPPDAAVSSRLYHNEGDFRFRDVTASAGLLRDAFALGVAVADYDADGHPDLYVTNLGANTLWRNEGDGTFRDVTAEAGVSGGGFVGSGAAFADFDRDGILDLFASTYVDFDPARNPERYRDGKRVYPGPLDYDPVPDVLYRGLGDGRFDDVTEESGIGAAAGRAMGVICLDSDGDGDEDIVVVNDEMANFLWENDGGGRFREVGVVRGVAFSGDGAPQGNMGVDCADIDLDGDLDLYTTTFSTEPPTLYRNAGRFFDDVTLAANAAAGLLPHVKWGTGFADFDDDGLPDLFVATGDFNEDVAKWWPATDLAVRNVVLRNVGGGRFEDVTDGCGPGLDVVASSRGIGLDDLDGDGRVDVVVNNWRGRPTLIRNESPGANAWLGIRLIGVGGNRDAVGARVRVTAGGTTQTAEVHAGRGYQSHHGTVLHFGLGAAGRADAIEVRWPGGATDVLHDVEVRRTVRIREGGGLE